MEGSFREFSEMKKFDKMISLGFDCEVSFNLESAGFLEHSLFSWAFTPLSSLVNILRNDFLDIFSFENIIPHNPRMVKDKKYNITFHSNMHSTQGGQFSLNENDLQSAYENDYSKINYLVKKWSNIVNSKLSVAYVIKIPQGVKYNDLLTLEDVFREKYPNHRYKIIVVYSGFDDNFFEFRKKINSECFEFFNVSFFSSGLLAYAGDTHRWIELFDKYSIKDKDVDLKYIHDYWHDKLSATNLKQYEGILEVGLGLASMLLICDRYVESLGYVRQYLEGGGKVSCVKDILGNGLIGLRRYNSSNIYFDRSLAIKEINCIYKLLDGYNDVLRSIIIVFKEISASPEKKNKTDMFLL